MWSRPIVVVAVVALLACVDMTSASSDSKIIAPIHGRVLTANHLGHPTKRLLRTDDADAEERGFGISTVKELVSSATSKVKLSNNLRAWLKQGESADDVAKFLILDDTVERVLSNPNFNALAKYISKFNAKNPKNKVAMIDVLTRRYGEAAVSKMLVAAKSVKSREVWATKLQGDQVAGWLKRDESTLGVFKILKLDDATTHPFLTRNLEAWENYAKILKKRKPEQAATMFDTFRKAYKDAGLAKLLEATSSRGPVGLKMKSSLYARWSKDGITKENINSKIFGLKEGDKINAATKNIISKYDTYLRTGLVAL
jgi:uncharacterized protein YjgD (DUF1641 family)